MRLLAYAGLGLWAGVTLLSYGWYFVLYQRMMSRRISKRSFFSGREMACFSDPKDYTEVGLIFRSRAIRAEIACIICFVILATIFVTVRGIFF